MLKFGKTPPRLLESFGVSGVLDESCHVFYSTLFSTKHVGRTTDLLSAKLLSLGLDDLRFRTLLLFTVFEGYRVQGATDPLIVECGKDKEKIAIGLSFTFKENEWPDMAALKTRISEKKPVGNLERVLLEIDAQADRLVVRYQVSLRRFEVISLLGIPGHIDEGFILNRQEIGFYELGAKEAAAPKAKEYTELGDLEYSKLLKEDAPGKKEAAISVGDILARSIRERDQNQNTRVGGAADPSDLGSTRIAGDGEKADGGALHIIRGEGTEKGSQFRQKTSGLVDEPNPYGEGLPLTDKFALESKIKIYKEKVEDLEQQIRALKAEKLNWKGASSARTHFTSPHSVAVAPETAVMRTPATSVSSTEARILARTETKTEAKAGEEKSQNWNFFKKIWPFKESPQSVPAADLLEPLEKQVSPIAPIEKEKALDAQAPSTEVEVEEDPATKSFASDLQVGSLEKVIQKASAESGMIQEKLPDTKTRRWVDHLITELVREKGLLNENARNLFASLKSKEYEFKRREMGMQEELRRKEEALKQKTNAHTHLKDQLSQLSMQIERFKSVAQEAEDGHYKQKHDMAKKMLILAREDNKRLTDKIEDLRGQLANVQLAATSRKSSSNEIVTLVAQNERLQRQVEEFKKNNQQLTERFNQTRKDRHTNNASAEEVKKKFELASKAVLASKKVAERLQLRVDELAREEERLKIELSRSQMELKKLKHGIPTGSSGGSGPANAA